ncbi:MAG TPA: lysophospholipid acyltransferase family protein [Pyrinomonadaceae bacterium]|nr:lysophospholipid acyltransferase family protein [Chloracidobacterium sp.]HRJ88688.1 lysophospholipid acyltransferase family protein [Pyrinomonadaceae bacterium]HRK49029.1 lysophospholipid acyltransferase family protein [Pyrinomonadaceae bacterium]
MSEDFQKAYQFDSLDRFTLKQRIVIRTVGYLGYLIVRLIGSTIRFEKTGWENFEAIKAAGKIPIYSFWHDRIIAGTYFFREHGIIVLSSSSFDSEYTARCIQRLGFGIVKGSSSRGGARALVRMIRMMKSGFEMAFTIDGPRGPRYKAKSGPIILAKKTGNPLMPFVIECEDYWTLKSWDRLQIPKPFTKANLIIGEPIFIESRARDKELEAKIVELQTSLDELVLRGEKWRTDQS